MGTYEPDVHVDSFEPDSDGLFRVRRDEVEQAYTPGEPAFVSDGELMGFARIMSVDGEVIVLDVLATTPVDAADELMELLADEWSDLLDED